MEVPELVGTGEVRAMLGVSKQRAYQITRQKGFPDPVQRLIQGPVWLRSDVEAWIRQNRP
jgi:prophage regulatory protein